MKISLSLVLSVLLALLTWCSPKTDCNKLLGEFESDMNAGNFLKAIQLADSVKKCCASDMHIIQKTDSLVQIAERINLDFSLSEDQFLRRLKEYAGVVSDSNLAVWDKNKWLEWRMINGEKKYFDRAASNLVLLKMFYEDKEKQLLEISEDPEMVSRLVHIQKIVKESGNKTDPVLPVNMKITYTITVHPDVVPEGEKIRCWLPWPKENHPRQQKPELLTTSNNNFIIAPDSAIHRSIYMEEVSHKGIPSVFCVSFLYQSSGQYFDLAKLKILPYNKTSDIYTKYTSEQLPHICFTENIRELADSITTRDDDPVTVVRKIYLWFKENIPWTGALEYSIMPNIPEYVTNNRRGDCGMQTFLFMSMLRYKGVPVRWQSGWKVPPGNKNLHDWCEVYYEGAGWVPVDISYDLLPSENKVFKEFFISGIDSYRLIVNEGVAGQLYPEKQHLRSEPYDFQRGEVEWKGGNLYFDKWDYEMNIEYLK
ncbi:MAG: transglutaminase-like domain-containing protein [Bacteroidales bacterium]|nr:transglutaminase-like domain-containing protein [Bacteroidales bacterium]